MKNLRVFGLTSGVKFLILAYPKNSLTLMNASLQSDGFGSQVQRIFSIKALADSLNLEFELKPIQHVERQITQEAQADREQAIMIREFNQFLRSLLSSKNQFLQPSIVTFQVYNLNDFIRVLIQNLISCIFLRRKIGIYLENAYDFTHTKPDLYAKLKFNSQFIHKVTPNRDIEVHVHLRFVNFAKSSERYLDPNYYYETLGKIETRLRALQSIYSIIIHSDFDTSIPASVTSGVSPKTIKYLIEQGILQLEENIDIETFLRANDCKNEIKKRFGSVVDFKPKSPIASVTAMASADFLVLSKSSFSFISGVLNTRGSVFSPSYWNQPLTSWNSDLD